MNRRVGMLLAGGLLSLVGPALLPATAMADSGSSSTAHTYVCNVGDSGSTATVQTDDIHSAAEALPAFLPMRLTDCRPAA